MQAFLATCWLMFSHLLVTNAPYLSLQCSIPATVTQVCSYAWIIVIKVQNSALGLVESHKTGLSTVSQPVQIPFYGLPTLRQISASLTQLGVISKPTKCALNLFIQFHLFSFPYTYPNSILLTFLSCLSFLSKMINCIFFMESQQKFPI